MRTASKLILAAAAASLLPPVGAGAQEAAFVKKGSSLAVQKRDSDRCWKLAQKARLSEEEANQNLLAGYLIGGIIGVLIVQASNEEANKEPRSFYRRQAHDACMEKLGYRKPE
jgi:hypothetical protein